MDIGPWSHLASPGEQSKQSSHTASQYGTLVTSTKQEGSPVHHQNVAEDLWHPDWRTSRGLTVPVECQPLPDTLHTLDICHTYCPSCWGLDSKPALYKHSPCFYHSEAVYQWVSSPNATSSTITAQVRGVMVQEQIPKDQDSDKNEEA